MLWGTYDRTSCCQSDVLFKSPAVNLEPDLKLWPLILSLRLITTYI